MRDIFDARRAGACAPPTPTELGLLVITGASGFVGSELVPVLAERSGRPFLLVSRDSNALRARFPRWACCDYEELAEHDLMGAVFVHLAARNNDRPGSLEDFAAANVEHLLRTATIARRSGAAKFINLCTTHALGPHSADPYGLTKKIGADKLVEAWPGWAVNLYVPAVYGRRFQGRIAALEKLPRVGRSAALAVLRQIKPAISIETLADEVLTLADHNFCALDNGQEFAADPIPENGLYSISKRTMDLMAAVAVLVLFGWAMAVVAVCVRVDSRGPAIFAQQRVGRHGRPFTCYKFRTMRVGTKQAATHEVDAGSVTRVGAFLRRTKLDELPQVVNILRNEMSLVGPRPCLPAQVALIAERARRGVLDMKPGVTGLAQVDGIDMSDPVRLAAWDARYSAFRTVLLDAIILMRTSLGGGSGDRIVKLKH